VKTKATVEDLMSAPEKAEFVNGQLLLLPPTGFLHGRAVGAIYFDNVTLTTEYLRWTDRVGKLSE
jgi:hypothetical protein